MIKLANIITYQNMEGSFSAVSMPIFFAVACLCPHEAAALRLKEALYPVLWDLSAFISIELPEDVKSVWFAG